MSDLADFPQFVYFIVNDYVVDYKCLISIQAVDVSISSYFLLSPARLRTGGIELAIVMRAVESSHGLSMRRMGEIICKWEHSWLG